VRAGTTFALFVRRNFSPIMAVGMFSLPHKQRDLICLIACRPRSFRHSVGFVSNPGPLFLLDFDNIWEWSCTTHGSLGSPKSESVLEKSGLYEPLLLDYLLQHLVPTFVGTFCCPIHYHSIYFSGIVFMRVSGILPIRRTSGGIFVLYKPSLCMWDLYGMASYRHWL
jgi:hypothetical protein